MIVETILIVLAVLVALAVPTIIITILSKYIMKASARNPSKANMLFWGMVGLLGLVEILAVVTVIILFQLFAK